MRSLLRSVFTPVRRRHTRAPSFLFFTGSLLLTLVTILGFAVWIAFLSRAQVRAHTIWFPGIFALVAALALAGQLIWTMTKGYVYCGHFLVVRKADDELIYKTYCLLHLLSIVSLALLALAFLR